MAEWVMTKDCPLTRRELEVLALVVEGHSDEQIARKLHLATITIHNHLRLIYPALNVHDRLHAVLQALKLGYVRVNWPGVKHRLRAVMESGSEGE